MRQRLEIGLRLHERGTVSGGATAWTSPAPAANAARRGEPDGAGHAGVAADDDDPTAHAFVVPGPEAAEPAGGIAVGREAGPRRGRRADGRCPPRQRCPTSSRASRWPRRNPPKVTVRSARGVPCTVPLSRSTPVGPSIATIGTSRSSEPLEQGRERRAGRSLGAGAEQRVHQRAPRRARARRAPPPARLPRGRGPPSRSRSWAPAPPGPVTQTGTPSRCSARASTQPSPPLWPGSGRHEHAIAQRGRVAVGDDRRGCAPGALHQRRELDAGRDRRCGPRRRIGRERGRGAWNVDGERRETGGAASSGRSTLDFRRPAHL